MFFNLQIRTATAIESLEQLEMMLTLPLLLTHCKEIQQQKKPQKTNLKRQFKHKLYEKKIFNAKLIGKGRETLRFNAKKFN